MLEMLFRRLIGRTRARPAILCVLLLHGSRALAQGAPVSSDHPWHGVGEQNIEADAKNFREPTFSTDPRHISPGNAPVRRPRLWASRAANCFRPWQLLHFPRPTGRRPILEPVSTAKLFKTFSWHWISTIRSLTLVRGQAELLTPERKSWQRTSCLMTHTAESFTRSSKPTINS